MVFVISKEWKVYSMKRKSLSTNRFVIQSTSDSIESQWPTLASDSIFKAVRAQPNNYYAVIATDELTSYVCFIGRNTVNSGLAYDILDPRIASHRWTYKTDSRKVAMISSDKADFIYAVESTNEFLQLVKLQFVDSQSLWLGSLKITNRYYICKTNSTMFRISKQVCEENPDWIVWLGFINQRQFYLFGPTGIFTFDDTIFTTNVEVQLLQYDEFFFCSETLQSKTLQVS